MVRKITSITALLFLLVITGTTYAQLTATGNAFVTSAPFPNPPVNCGSVCADITGNFGNQVGAAWGIMPMDLSQFQNINLCMYLGSDTSSLTGGEGMVFVLQNDPALAASLGLGGGGMGYNGIAPSVGIEFDTYDNSGVALFGDAGNSNNHINVSYNGNQSAPVTPLVDATVTGNPIATGVYHTVNITWSPECQRLKVFFNGVLRIDYTDDLINSVFGGNNTVLYGITASTGILTSNDHLVCVDTIISATPIDLGPDTFTCNMMYPLDATMPGATYLWQDGITTSSIFNAVATGLYFVDVTYVNGGDTCTYRDSINLIFNELPPITTSPDVALCVGDPEPTLFATGSGIPGTNLQWYTNQMGGTVGMGSPFNTAGMGLFTTMFPNTSQIFVREELGGCFSPFDTITVTVYAGASTPIVMADSNYCFGPPPTFTASGTPGATYQWFVPSLISPTPIAGVGTTYQPFLFSFTQYTVWVKEVVGGCVSADSLLFTFYYRPIPAAPTASVDTLHCFGDLIAPVVSTPPANAMNNIAWFSDPELTNLLDTGVTYDPTTYIALNGGSGLFTFYNVEQDSFCDGPYDSVNVTVIPTIVPGPVLRDTYCFGDPIGVITPMKSDPMNRLDWYDSIPPGQFLVTINSYNPPIAGPGTDTVWYIERDMNGCESVFSMAFTHVNPLPTADAGPDDTICQGGALFLNGTAAPGASFYWSANPDSAKNFLSDTLSINPIVTTPSNVGGYNIIYTLNVDNGECPNSDNMVLRVAGFPTASVVGLDSSFAYCINHPPIQLTGIPQPSVSGGIGFFLATPYLDATGLFDPSLVPNGPGFYDISYFYEAVANCFDTITYTLEVLPLPSAEFVIDTFGCIGDTIVASYIGGANIDEFDWFFANANYIRGKDGGAYQLVWYGPGIYPINLRVLGQNGCYNDTTINITIQGPLINTIDDVTIDYGDNVTLFTTQIPDSLTFDYLWTPSTFLDYDTAKSPTSFPTSSTTYIVSAIDSFGCVDYDTVRVRVFVNREIYMPNTFTPNGDNVNDFLQVYGKGVDQISWGVYNRWGEKVFNGESLNDRWDGTHKGSELNPAVFTYYIGVTYFDGKQQEFKGNVTLIK